tara:strand:+ start:146 stop:532 length:387 start_codon:yes stop_codon:yes gene_type:complete
MNREAAEGAAVRRCPKDNNDQLEVSFNRHKNMPRPNAKIRFSANQKAQLAKYINNIILHSRRSGRLIRDEEFFEKAKRSIVSFLKDYYVGPDQADNIARNLLPLFSNFRSGDIDFIEGVVDAVCDDSS